VRRIARQRFLRGTSTLSAWDVESKRQDLRPYDALEHGRRRAHGRWPNTGLELGRMSETGNGTGVVGTSARDASKGAWARSVWTRSALPTGDRVVGGRYRLRELLGVGGQGSVWLATHVPLGRDVAVKLLPSVAATDKSIGRLRREARALFDVQDRALPRLIDHGWDPTNEVYFVAMERLRGQTLAQVVERRGAILAREASVIAEDIGGALDALHRAGLVHRDVTPANVMVDLGPDGLVRRAWLLDLGVVWSGEGPALSTEGNAPGSIAYQPPDVQRECDASGRPAPSIDQYMLAATLTDALRGALINRSELAVSLFDGVNTPHRFAISDIDRAAVPRHVLKALRRALCRQPSMRFADVKTFVAAFHGEISPWVGVPRRWLRRDLPRIAITMAAAIGLAAAVVGLAVWLDDGEDPGMGAATAPMPARVAALRRARRCAALVDERRWTLPKGAPEDCARYLEDLALVSGDDSARR
jgi:hypothetical protein